MKSQKVVGFLTVLLLIGSSLALADMKQLKAYKEAFPGAAVKCAHCHTAAMPKKDGDHALNAYGQKVVAISNAPTAADYKAAGKE
jgi:cytochrome c